MITSIPPLHLKFVFHDGLLIRLHRDWRKGLPSQGNSNCVEWRFTASGVEVRNSRFPDGPVILYTWDEWLAFTTGVKNGEADLVPLTPQPLPSPWVGSSAN